MRKLILLLAAALPLCAQLTTVTGTLSGPLGNGSPSANRLTATLTFKALSTFHAANGAVVPAQSSQTITVTGGAFSLALVPTDTAAGCSTSAGCPAYEVTGRIPLQTPDGRNCEVTFTLVNQGLCTVPASTIGPLYLSVPTSATPVNFGSYIAFTKPPAGVRIPYGSVDFLGLPNGCFAILNGAPSIFACGQLAAGLTWTQQTLYAWTQM